MRPLLQGTFVAIAGLTFGASIGAAILWVVLNCCMGGGHA